MKKLVFPLPVIPAQSGIQRDHHFSTAAVSPGRVRNWIPAYAGMTAAGCVLLLACTPLALAQAPSASSGQAASTSSGQAASTSSGQAASTSSVPAPDSIRGQAFPAKPVRFILGPSSEVLPRIVAQRLSTMWGYQVLVDPRPGGGGTIAADTVAKAPPDGHTWLLSTATFTVSASLLANPPFDLARDFQAVTLLASAPFYLMTHPSLPVKTVKELTAFAKTRPGQLNYGSSGRGTPPHMAAEMYKSMAGLDVMHVPYKTVAAAVTDHIAGQVHVSFQYGPSSLPVVRAGRLRGLAVTSLKRSRFAPELPTMDESGVSGYEIIGWNGIHLPQRTPVDLINKLNTDLRQALQGPEVQERLTAASLDIHGTTRAEFEAFVNKDRARWAKVVKDARITPE